MSDNPSEAVWAVFFPVFGGLKFSIAQREVLSQLISTNEILDAIALKTAKAPDLDGFTSEFYKTFKYILITKLHKLFTEIFKHSVVPSSWQEAAVVVIPKVGKDLSLP